MAVAAAETSVPRCFGRRYLAHRRAVYREAMRLVVAVATLGPAHLAQLQDGEGGA